SFLPDGRHFLYSAVNNSHSERTGVYVGAIDAPDARLLFRAPASAAFTLASSRGAPTSGYVLSVDEGSLKARAFDARALRLTGDVVAIADGVGLDPSAYESKFSVSQAGVLVYAP